MRKDIEEALAAWRDAARRLENANDGDRDAIAAEVAHHRETFQRLTSEFMINRIDNLREAERRRSAAQPSTDRYHAAAREEKAIAAEIWDSSRISDEEIPGRADQQDEEAVR